MFNCLLYADKHELIQVLINVSRKYLVNSPSLLGHARNFIGILSVDISYLPFPFA